MEFLLPPGSTHVWILGRTYKILIVKVMYKMNTLASWVIKFRHSMMTIKGGIIKETGNRKLNEGELSFLSFLIVVKQ